MTNRICRYFPLFLIILTITSCSAPKLPQVRAIAYSAVGDRLLLATGKGIYTFMQRRWQEAIYTNMSLEALQTLKGGYLVIAADPHYIPEPVPTLYTFGDPGSSWRSLPANKLNRSTLFAASYSTGTIYLLDHKELRFSKNQGVNWQEVMLQGLSGKPTAIAVHPENYAIVVLGTEDGLYISRDYGTHLAKRLSDLNVTAVAVHPNGIIYIAGTRNGQAVLKTLGFFTLNKGRLPIPPALESSQTQIIDFAVDPNNDNHLALLTSNQDIYVSEDRGAVWVKILDQGEEIGG